MPNQHTNKEPIIERFWRHVDKTPGHGPWGNCWVWTMAKTKQGYGSFGPYPGTKEVAHRWLYEYLNGELGDTILLHKCDNPPCVRQDHLSKGTHQDNQADKVNKGRQAKRESHGRAKLNWEKVRTIRNDTRDWQDIADEYGVSRTLIKYIMRGDIWKEEGASQ
jgi:hypothetical protein